MRSRLPFYGVALLFFLVGCSKSSSPSPTPTPTASPEVVGDGSELDRHMREATLKCAIPEGCPFNIGMVGNRADTPLGPAFAECTGFLIAGNIVATNSHCVPEALKTSSADCARDLKIRFYGEDPVKVHSCRRIISSSSVKIFTPDYAFFEIDSTDHVPLTITDTGIHGNQVVKRVSFTPDSQIKFGGSITTDQCKIVLHSLLNPASPSPFSETGVAMDCEVVHGNSGSPLLNDRGEVVGIFQAIMRDEYLSLLRQYFTKFNFIMPENLPRNGQFTNLSCVETPVSHRRPECDSAAKIGFAACLGADNPHNDESEKNVLEGWRKDLPAIFKYKYHYDIGKFTYTAEPICVVPQERAGAAYGKYVQWEGVIGFRTEKLDASFANIMRVRASLRADQDFVVLPNIDFAEAGRMSVKITLSHVPDGWAGTASAPSGNTVLDWFQEEKLNLLFCTDTQMHDEESTDIKIADGSVLSESDYRAKMEPKVDPALCDKP